MVEARSSMGSNSSGGSTPRSTSLDQYKMGQVLGQGAYGRVLMATEIATGQTVAIKEVNQKQIMQLGKQRHIFREKDLLNEMDHPFIIKLLGTTKDETNLYFVFENCEGGDLAALIQERRMLDIRLVRLYAAQLIHILEYMQSLLVMHRDLKPQNIMLDENSNIKVIDFGDAKKENEEPLDEIPEPQQEEPEEAKGDDDGFSDAMSGGMDRRGTMVGTMNYVAPEMINSQQATLTTDLWALGNIIFKMYTGNVPFTGTQSYTVFPKINNREIEWPSSMQMDPACRDLIDKLIVVDPEQRLGAPATGGMGALKQHPFFQGIDWNCDMKKLGLKRVLRETEPIEMRQRKIDDSVDPTLPQFKYALIEPGKPILTGLLLKKNRFWIKQERRFELFMEGYIRYYENTKLKGEMKLSPDAKAVFLSRTEVEITLPSHKKNYLLVQQDLSKCPAKSQYFSCTLNDWVDAINYVCATMAAEQEQ